MENPNPTDAAPQVSENITTSAKEKRGFKMNRRTALFVVIILAIIGVVFYFKGLLIAATVNGTPISRLEVIRELENTSGRQALDALIVKQLINTEANKAGITVSQEDVDAEIKTLGDRITKQGGTLELVLAQQGITQDQFRAQILLQKKLEKILEDSVQITDEEVDQYFTQNKITPPAGSTDNDIKNQIRAQLKNQKFSAEAEKWVTEHKTQASIQYYVGYGVPESEPAPITPPADTQNNADTQNK
jgi:parvulin-like peptidyl-prolyl isomerase